MPRKGKRSQAQKVRWARLDLADPAPVSPTTSTHQMPETPPPTSRLWAMENAPTPTNSPAYKLPHWPHKEPHIEEPQQRRGKPIFSVRATHSQNDHRYNIFSRNHQCTCMALTFLAYHSEGSQFNTANLDRMLEIGDSLYVGIKSQLVSEGRYVDDHLTVEEMPQQALTDNNVYKVRMSPIRCGYMKAQGQPGGWLTMEAQLQSLSTDVSNAILIVSPECIAVFRDR
ncbi:hypothetical protein D5F01_LYC23990 [Larimichthys crocea]|uniref:Uncharacterized protein n=1 Tax=Larimichthys crocea TaxID=215358 RepID=A0A6G0HG05_LARCR|nr:hypothetical protein D5F01_LYC23990 [Larimichthys crocea]